MRKTLNCKIKQKSPLSSVCKTVIWEKNKNTRKRKKTHEPTKTTTNKQKKNPRRNPRGYMLPDAFYLFLWDNIKLHTVNVSIIGFGVLVFSSWTHIFQKSITWQLEVPWRFWSLLYLSSAWGTDPLCSRWNWTLTSLALVGREGAGCCGTNGNLSVAEEEWTSLIYFRRTDYLQERGACTYGKLYPKDFAPIVRLKKPVLH